MTIVIFLKELAIYLFYCLYLNLFLISYITNSDISKVYINEQILTFHLPDKLKRN